MQAQGEHLLVRLPNKQKATEGGLLLPDNFGQVQAYGRIVSMGDKVLDLLGDADREGPAPAPGVLVCFDAMGARDVELDSLKDSELRVLHASQVFFTMVDKQLEARKLPLPS